MYYDNLNNYQNWFQKNTKDSYKYSEKLGKLGAKIQSVSDKINNLKDIKVEVVEKSLDNNEKTFTLKVVGNLNINNKSFIKEIAEQFASILDDYKTKKIEELSKELDSTIEEMKNVFPPEITFFGSGSSSNIFIGDILQPQKTWYDPNNPNLVQQNQILCSVNGTDTQANMDVSPTLTGNLLLENKNENVIKTVISWKKE